jgi:autotransporter-associated beta strand protein
MNTRLPVLPRRLLLGTLALAAIGSCPQKALAQTFNWAVDGGGSWITDTNWTPLVVGDWPKDAGDIANLNFNLTQAAAITLDAAITVGGLTIGDTNATHSYTLSNGAGGSLTFDNSGSAATLTESATALGDTIAATLRTAGDLNIVNLNTTATRVFTLSGPLTSSAAAGTQTVTFSQSSANAAVAMTGAISNGGTGGTIALNKTGSGVLTLGATNSYTGGTTLSAGTIAGNAAGALTGTFTQSGTSTVRINNYAVLDSVDTAAGLTLNASAGTLTLASNAVTGNALSIPLTALNVSGSYAIRGDNNGTALAAATVFTLAAPLNISGNPTITSSSGTNASVTIGGLTTLNSNVTIAGTTTFRLNTVAEDATPRKITKTGSSLINMQGVANFTGGMDVLNGTVQFSAAGSSGSGLIQLGDVSGSNSAELRVAGGVTAANDITVRSGSSGTMKIARDTSTVAGTATYSGLVTLQKATTFEDVSTANAGTAPLEFTGKITGADVKITVNARTGDDESDHPLPECGE